MAPRKPKNKTKANSQAQVPYLNPAQDTKTLYTALTHCALRYPDGFKFRESITPLTHLLFQQLDARFKEFSSHNLLSNCGGLEELTLLLRCCLVILILIASDQSLLLEKGGLLLSILSRFLSIEIELGTGAGGGNQNKFITFKNMVSRECVYQCVNSDCTSTTTTTTVTHQFVDFACISLLEPSHPCDANASILCVAVLEVFADELLVHKRLREYIMVIDSAFSRSKMLFSCHFGHGNIACVLEVICAHLFVSVSDEQSFENFLNRLFWCRGEDFRIPAMSLTAALSLLLNPILPSAPKMLQSYVVLLVSEAIGICMPSGNRSLDPELMECYLKAFERSVILYTRHMSSLHINDRPLGDNDSFVESCLLGSKSLPTFESLLQPATRDKLCFLIDRSNNSWDSYISCMRFRTNSDLVAASTAYVKESLDTFDESYRDEVFSILSCIILGGSSVEVSDTVLHKKVETNPQDIFLLASILKLMGSSLLQAIWYVRQLRFSSYPKSLKDVSLCKEYNAIVDIISWFEQLSIHLPTQKFLCEMMHLLPARNKKSQWMFLHFSGLLSFSCLSRIDFLVKDSLFNLMTLLTLFITEEGDLSLLGSVFRSRSESSSSESSDKVEGGLVVRKSTLRVSSRIQKIQEIYLRKVEDQVETSEYVPDWNGTDAPLSVVDTEERCNGEIFLRCVLGQRRKRPSDFDELADFIECRPGKDYTGWLRDRQRFRLWRQKKMTLLRWKKKKMIWNSVKEK